MMRRAIFLGVLFASALFIPMQAAEDSLSLHEGQVIKGEILSIGKSSLTFRTKIAEVGSSSRQIDLSDIDFIEFAPETKEFEIMDLASPQSLNELRGLWRKKRPRLAMPNSRAGEVGLLFAKHLVAKGAAFHQRAYEILEQVEARDWNEKNRKLASRDRLSLLIAMGEYAQAISEAEALEKQSDDPALLIQARIVLAEADLEKLRTLQEENPRWSEDDWVRPERMELYHRVLDQFLYPFLFYGAPGIEAARGLWGAVQTCLLSVGEKDRELVKRYAQDLVLLYPQSEQAQQARALLLELGIEPESLDLYEKIQESE